MLIADEGHMMRNAEGALSTTLNQIQTRRRVVLTGTPMQNKLKEYHCMVHFVRPDLLGNLKEFNNQYVNLPTLYCAWCSLW